MAHRARTVSHHKIQRVMVRESKVLPEYCRSTKCCRLSTFDHENTESVKIGRGAFH